MTTAAFGIVALLHAVSGCDFGLIGGGEANTARVVVDANDLDATLRVVTSTDFAPSSRGGEPVLRSADTTEVMPLFERTYGLPANRRFYAEAGSADSSEITISMRVWIGVRKEFDATRTVTEEILRFSFVSNEFGF